MNVLKIYRRCLMAAFAISAILFCVIVYGYVDRKLPEQITMKPNYEANLDTGIPVSLTDKKTNEKTKVSSKISIKSRSNGDFKFVCKLLGFIPVKEVDVTVTNAKYVTPVGLPVGLYLHTEGVMVVDIGDVTDTSGNIHNPAKDRVFANDYIVGFNDEKVNSKSQLIFLINQNGSNNVRLKLKRDNEIAETTIKPVKDRNGEYKLGIWVRDDTQGIGTMTYVDSKNNFGALGHGVSDIDTGKLLDSKKGKIYCANIWGIKKGENGNPGGLCGTIEYLDSNILGDINKNTNNGLYGCLKNKKILETLDLSPVEVAYKQDVKKGKAYIRLVLDGKINQYEVEIRKINIGDNVKEKNFVIKVTDEALLEKTNGILQGMSGAPLIQNGKIIGAVTHVFVDDPTQGYGIFIENMIKNN